MFVRALTLAVPWALGMGAAQAGISLEHAAPDLILLEAEYPSVLVATVREIRPSAQTNGDPPRCLVEVHEVLKGRTEAKQMESIWTPIPHDIDWVGSGAAEAIRAWAQLPNAPPPLGSKWILSGRIREDGVLVVAPRCRFPYSRHLLQRIQFLFTDDVDVVRRLIQQGFDVRSTWNDIVHTQQPPTPLHLAAERGRTGIADVLIGAGADLAARYEGWVASFETPHHERGLIPLHLSQNRQVAELLIRHGSDVSARTETGATLLHLTANLEIADLAIARGVAVDARDAYGQTALHWAAKDRTALAKARFLIKRGADVNLKDATSNTPLGYAADVALDPKMVRLLLQSGAAANVDFSRSPVGGVRPLLHWAIEIGCRPELSDFSEIPLLLIDAGISVSARDALGSTALHVAAANGCATIARRLLDKGADAEARDSGGRTPLHIAAELGWRIEVARLLLDRVKEVNSQDRDGRTPLDYAVSKDMIGLLRLHGGRHSP